MFIWRTFRHESRAGQSLQIFFKYLMMDKRLSNFELTLRKHRLADSVTWQNSIWILIIALCPIYTLYAICLNLISGRSWNEDLVPDLGPIGFKGDFKIIQLRYCLLFMLIYVGCNAIYVAALKFIPNMVARRVSHFPTSSLITFKIKRALATTPLCHLL